MRSWKEKKRHIFLILISILTMASVGSVQATEQTTEQIDEKKVSDQSLTNAQQEMENLETALQEAQELISELENSQEDVETKIVDLDTKMTSITNQMNDLESRLDAKNAAIANTETLLAQSEEDAENQYENMKLRIQYMYENTGNMSYMELFCSSGSVAEFLDAAEYVYQISEYDRQMLEQYQSTIELVAETKSQLEQEYADLAMMQAQLEDQKAAVEALRSQKEIELNSIGEQLTVAENDAQLYENEIAAQEEVINEIKTQLALQKQKEENGTATTTAPSYTGGAFVWPCPSSQRVTSDYGVRLSPTAGASSNHKGIDIGASYGADIVAAADGEVIYSGYTSASGNHVIINHGDGLCTVYMHASSLNVSVGDKVSAGQVIAKVGSTGISTGNHLHFGVSLNGTYVSPWNYLS